jgi:hypothetical protein
MRLSIKDDNGMYYEIDTERETVLKSTTGPGPRGHEGDKGFYKLHEALEEMHKGNIMKCKFGSYKIENDTLYCKVSSSNQWFATGICINDALNLVFFKCREEE